MSEAHFHNTLSMSVLSLIGYVEFDALNYFLSCIYWKIPTDNRGMIIRIFHRSPMQTEKSQPEGKRMMPETMYTEFPALSIDPMVGISPSARRPMIDYISYIFSDKSKV